MATLSLGHWRLRSSITSTTRIFQLYVLNSSAMAPCSIRWRQFSASKSLGDAEKSRLEREIRAVMADPGLTETQKYIMTKRLFAFLDWHITLRDMRAPLDNGMITSVSLLGSLLAHLFRRDPVSSEAVRRFRLALDEHEACCRKLIRAQWVVGKVLLSAPKGETGLAKRAGGFLALALINGLLLPFLPFARVFSMFLKKAEDDLSK